MAQYHASFIESINSGKFSKEFHTFEWPKLQQAAEVHGYRGASKKKHNGIVPIRPSDKGLLKTLRRLAPHNTGQPIKVVAHVPSGNRLVGYRQTDGSVIIYGLANYSD